MSEYIYPVVTGLTGTICGVLATYVMAKRMLSDDKIMDKIDLVLTEVSQSEELQRKIYMVGGILGKGLRDGVGIDRLIPKGSKKGGIEGLIMDLIGGFVKNKMGIQDSDDSNMNTLKMVEPKSPLG